MFILNCLDGKYKDGPWSRGSSGDGDAAGARKHCIIFSHSLLLLGERERESQRGKRFEDSQSSVPLCLTFFLVASPKSRK